MQDNLPPNILDPCLRLTAKGSKIQWKDRGCQRPDSVQNVEISVKFSENLKMLSLYFGSFTKILVVIEFYFICQLIGVIHILGDANLTQKIFHPSPP